MPETFLILKEYFGSILFLGSYVLSFAYLCVTEKKKEIRIALVYYPAMMLMLFLLPPVHKLVSAVMNDTTIYYRLLWLLPASLTIGYAGVKVISELKNKWIRIPAIVLCLCVLVGTGDYMYDNPYFSRAENRFHIPGAVQLICDAISIPGREVRAAFPPHQVMFVRQYDPTILMPYGRNIQIDGWDKFPEQYGFYEAMSQPTIDCKTVAEYAVETGTQYVIVHMYQPLEGTFEEFGYQAVANVDDYVIYCSTGSELFSLW